MISKRVNRGKKTSSFERLGHYVLEAKKPDAAILWTRTAEYVVDMNETGEKVLWSRLSNCEAEIPAMAIAEILATQALNTRSKADKTYHLIISFPESEIPTREQLEDIEDRMCEALGFGEHQRISAVHQDTDNIHLHLAINKIHPVTFKAHEPYYDYLTRNKQCRELEKKHGLMVDNGIGQGKRMGRAGDLESHTGEQSFLGWIKEHLAEELKALSGQSQSWADLHVALAEYELIIKPRGAGLVIASADGLQWAKASSVDRGFSFKTLSDRFGEYQPSRNVSENERGGTDKQKAKNYQRGPRQPHMGAGSLYGQYQKEKEILYQNKAKALHQLRAEHAEFGLKLKDWYRQKRTAVQVNSQLTAKSKRVLYTELSAEKKADFAQRKALETQQRQDINEQYPTASWDNWLVDKASQGNAEALAVLRSRKLKREQLAQSLLTVETLDEAKDIIYPHLKPKALKNGAILYRVKDGGLVSDEARAIRVPEVTEAASLLALALADERFKGQAIVVEGSIEFKLQVAKQAALEGLSVQFADPVLEKDRQRFVQANEMNSQHMTLGPQPTYLSNLKAQDEKERREL